MEEKRERLKEFFLEIRECRKCGLHSTRNKSVFGSGNAEADIMFVGEAPGKNEDIQGLPFVGRAGNILDTLLASISMGREDIFIANVLKCRPPGNRDPQAGEISICKEYLFRQIQIIDPRMICTMGKHSTQLILDTKQGITGLRGKIFTRNGRLVLPINHPAAVLYAPSRMETLMQDFFRIKKLIDSGYRIDPGTGERQTPKEVPGPEDDSKQLGLF
jgi:uracil-DNA glycosylase